MRCAGDEVPPVRAEAQVTHLRISVDRIQQSAVVRVPHLDALVLCPAAADQHAGQRRAPRERLDGGRVVLELPELLIAPHVPDLELVFIAAAGQTAVQLVLLQPAHLLLVLAKFQH